MLCIHTMNFCKVPNSATWSEWEGGWDFNFENWESNGRADGECTRNSISLLAFLIKKPIKASINRLLQHAIPTIYQLIPAACNIKIVGPKGYYYLTHT